MKFCPKNLRRGVDSIAELCFTNGVCVRAPATQGLLGFGSKRINKSFSGARTPGAKNQEGFLHFGTGRTPSVIKWSFVASGEVKTVRSMRGGARVGLVVGTEHKTAMAI